MNVTPVPSPWRCPRAGESARCGGQSEILHHACSRSTGNPGCYRTIGLSGAQVDCYSRPGSL